MGSPDNLATIFLEVIGLMSKRFVQTEWPQLIPELSGYLDGSSQTTSPEHAGRALEAIKKICKKYRYMFRSDDLYREMNYMITTLSPLLLNSLIVSITLAISVVNNLTILFVWTSLQ